MPMRRGLLSVAALLASLAGTVTLPAAENPGEKELRFETHVRPILKAHCFLCHGEEHEIEGSLDLRLVRLMATGGDSGPALVAGQPEESLLLARIEAGEMPPGDKKLSPDEVSIIRQWIEQGARTVRPEPDNVNQAEFTEEERQFWAFQPIRRPEVPLVDHAQQVQTPIDAFLLARLEAQGLSLSPRAERATLVRRAYFDLLGLPPSPEEVAAFCADSRPDAWEQLIDRLLASPRYGERWGRHWLDVAGYADSDGYSETDAERPYAYKYRDYVIRAFNADKPFDAFIQEQLAGDELVGPPYENLSPHDSERLIATGFLRMGPDGTADPAVAQMVARNEVIAETIKIVSTSLLGLTVGCAQCHNHRFDPILHTDYFRLRSIFEPAYDWKAWRTPKERLISLWSNEERQAAQRVQAELKQLAAERMVEIRKQLVEVLETPLAKVPEAERSEARTEALAVIAVLGTNTKPTPQQAAIFKKYPRLKVTETTLRQLTADRYFKELKEYEAQVAAIKAKGPAEDYIQALTEVPGKIPTTHLFLRGDHTQPGPEVLPGELSVLSPGDRSVVPVDDPALKTSGRRLAYARHLTSGKHPLTPRVLVNRFWMHHFGQAIVSTPGDFGLQGDLPSHPELLDWLADEFMRTGWRLKPWHKLVMMSTAYQQSSRRTPQLDAGDPDNRLLGRMNVRRLEAETIRDTTLTLAGHFNGQMFGPPMPVAADGVGQVLIGLEASGREGIVKPLRDGQDARRSLYVQARRSLPLAMLEVFDSPTMLPNCEKRSSSTVTPQSLLLMNNRFVVEQSEQIAQQIMAQAGQDQAVQLQRAWQLILGTEPSDAQLQRAAQFLSEQHSLLAANLRSSESAARTPRFAGEPKSQALANFCQLLLSSNAFLYVD